MAQVTRDGLEAWKRDILEALSHLQSIHNFAWRGDESDSKAVVGHLEELTQFAAQRYTPEPGTAESEHARRIDNVFAISNEYPITFNGRPYASWHEAARWNCEKAAWEIGTRVPTDWPKPTNALAMAELRAVCQCVVDELAINRESIRELRIHLEHERNRAVAKLATTVNGDAVTEVKGYACSDDHRSANWFGTTYSFTANQAPVVKLLIDHLERGTPDVADETLLNAVDPEAPPARLNAVFRNNPAWGTMIVSGATKGTHRLAPPR